MAQKKEFQLAIEQIAAEKNIPLEKIIETIEAALAAAYRKDFGTPEQNIRVKFNVEDGSSKVFDVKTVVESIPEDPEEQKEAGIKQKLCCLSLADSRTVAIGKEPIRVGEKIIGWVAAGGFGYSVGKSIIYAYLPIEYSKVGTKLMVEFFGENVGAVVEPSPLWDPKADRIRA